MATCPKCQCSVSPANHFCTACGATIASTVAAEPKDHQLPHTLQPPPKAQPKTMGERVALSVFMFIIGVPIMFIGFIACNWAVDGSLIIEIPHGIQFRLSILIAAGFAFKTLFDD